ncbi:MAG TPA: PilX N-terminal domain-containing pilus assembly protein [Candidatus Sulfotelmatobacter sp.]|nr:PilX N-terminal domain-containing pilus assembly protein [Candidatus Sulfotelmatobacter sp.]
MRYGKNSSRGFTLIAALIIMVLLSGIAIGMLYMVSNESHMGGNDLEENLAYYGAESGMEKLTSDLASLYQANLVPTNAQIQNLINFPPTSTMVGSMKYNETISYPLVNGQPQSSFNTIHSGSNQGLYAEIVPMTLQVIASRPSGASVNMTRNVEVALIPVFQFGVFCGFDCSYFAGPDFSFGGRVHTNQNLFLAAGGDLVFNDKVQAFSQIIMDQLENGNLTTNGYGGTVYVSTATGGCPLNTFPPTGANCKSLPGAATVPGDASWSGGYPTVAGAANNSFPSLSSGTFNYYVANSLTGVTNLQLPFVQNSCTSNPPPCTDPIAIVRKPLAGEAATGTLGSERLYNKAQIRILIADDPADLHPERGVAPIDSQDVQLPNQTNFSSPGSSPFNNGFANLTAGSFEYLGWGVVGSNGWVSPNIDSGPVGWGAGTQFPLFGELTTNPTSAAAMTGPWIRVEWCSGPTTCTGVTKEWLGLGFGRLFNTVPTSPGSNTVDPNAILILQELRPSVAQAQSSGHGPGTQNNWYPINFYDTREGEMRDNNVANTTLTPSNIQPGYPSSFTYSSCSVNGIMNAVELDVGNLNQWLQGKIGATGANVPYASQNGYVLYFSDHRGMKKDPNPSNGGQTPGGSTVYSGESGIEDVVNSAQNLTSTTTDGALEGTTYYNYSPEDVDQNGFLDNWGEKNIGYGFATNTNTTPLNPYLRVGVTPGASYTGYVDCAGYNTTAGTWLTGTQDQEGMANPVSGARHVLKLVDGGMSGAGQSYVPVIPPTSGCSQSAANPTGCGGFTIASENPVYIQGNYNSNAADAFWGTANAAIPTQTPHSAAAVIADSVTVLSNQWSDASSLLYPTVRGNRGTTADGYYRLAVAGGKNVPFPQPGWAAAAGIKDFGTDGGMHNFLRYLESWNNTLHYNGSLVNMYYSEYNTGTFKCCTTVYSPPTRNYYFDVLFLNPANLPPATPEFQDVVNLSYHQNFTPQ